MFSGNLCYIPHLDEWYIGNGSETQRRKIHPNRCHYPRSPCLKLSNTSSVCWNMNQRATKEREHPHKSLELSLLYFPSLLLMSLLTHLAPPSHRKKATNTPMSTMPEAMRDQLAWGSVSSPAAFCLSLAGLAVETGIIPSGVILWVLLLLLSSSKSTWAAPVTWSC